MAATHLDMQIDTILEILSYMNSYDFQRVAAELPTQIHANYRFIDLQHKNNTKILYVMKQLYLENRSIPGNEPIVDFEMNMANIARIESVLGINRERAEHLISLAEGNRLVFDAEYEYEDKRRVKELNALLDTPCYNFNMLNITIISIKTRAIPITYRFAALNGTYFTYRNMLQNLDLLMHIINYLPSHDKPVYDEATEGQSDNYFTFDSNTRTLMLHISKRSLLATFDEILEGFNK